MTINHSKPSLTIFADASLYADRGVAGWGGWARGDDREPTLHGGSAPFSPDSATVELWAMALFVERLRADGYITAADKSIILQSDSLSALNFICARIPKAWVSKAKNGGAAIVPAKRVKGEAEEPIRRIAEALAGVEVIYLRHVRGHEGGGHARSWVNEQCDKRAKREARAQFAEAGQ